METETPKTLAEIDASLSSEPAHSQALIPGSELGLDSLPHENGVRVPAGDVGVANETRVVEFPVKNFLGTNWNAVGGDCGFIGDARARGGLCSSNHEREDETENGEGCQAIKILGGCESNLLTGNNFDRKVEFDENGSSIFVEAHGPLASGKNGGHGDVKGSMDENGGDPGGKFMEIPRFESEMGDNGYATGEGGRKHVVKRNGNENGEYREQDEGEDGEDGLEIKWFPNMATDTTKPLVDLDVSLSSKPANFQAPMPATIGDLASFDPRAEIGSIVCAHENGARVSVGDATLTNETEEKAEHGAGYRAIKKLADCDSSFLIEDGSDTKVDINQNGISIFVEVRGSLERGYACGENCGHDDYKGSMYENVGDPSGNIAENGDVTGEEGRKHEVDCKGNENEVDKDEDGEENKGEDGADQELEYVVGDFVWGKIRGHPWWPGQIYDSSDASEYARKYNQKERLLVAYFGDGSFSWCFPSQLKPFAEDFEEMSKQSTSNGFVNALQKALDEIGRLVEWKMTCSCIPEGSRIGLARPTAKNAGIKQGVLVPECDVSRLSILQHGPTELVATLRYVAEVGSIINMFELTVLRSTLSAFYRAKGGQELSMYQEPQYIEELEDENGNWVTDMTDFSGPVEVPVEGPVLVHHGCSQTDQSLLQKCQRRKKKSVAKLMRGDAVIGANNKKGNAVKDVTSPGKLVSTSGKKKRKGSEEDVVEGGSDFTSPSERKSGRRKKTELLGSPKSTENTARSPKNGGGQGEEEEEEENKQGKVSSIENDGSDAKEETVTLSVSRERRRSKYLSPPFTSLNWTVRNSNCKRGSESEPVKIAKVSRMGEQMTMAADQFVGSPSLVKFSDQTFQEKLTKGLDTEVDTSDNPSAQPPKAAAKKIIESMEINASTKEVVSQVKSAALNPIYLREKNVVDMMEGFISGFRSAVYVKGSHYKMYHNLRPGRKRKSMNSGPSDVDEASRLRYIKQKLEMMTSMLENSNGNTLDEMKSSLEGEMKGLLEKVMSMAESNPS